MSLCSGAAGRPTICGRTAMLLRSRRAAPWMPPILLPHQGGLSHPAQPLPAALLELKRSIPSHQPLLFMGVASRAPVPMYREKQLPHEDPGQAMSGPSTPSWDRHHSPGGPAAPKALSRPARGQLTSSTGRMPQTRMKTELGAGPATGIFASPVNHKALSSLSRKFNG